MPCVGSNASFLATVILLFGLCACVAVGCGHQSSPSSGGRVTHPNPDVTIEVDTAPRESISPRIFGVNGTAFFRLAPPGTFELIRLGGSRYSAYNWRTNDSNAGSDYHHQNDDYLSASTEPAAPIAEAISTGVPNILVTVPMIGWVSRDRAADGDVALTPNYRRRRFVQSVADCTQVTQTARVQSGSRTSRTQINRDDRICQDEFVRHVLSLRRGDVPNIDFALDNEPDGWHAVHPRLRALPSETPAHMTYRELIERSTEYARAIRAVDPRSRVFGPVSFGFPGYVNLADAPDASDHPGTLFLDFYLEAMLREQLLDVLDLHWYPNVLLNDGTATQVAVASGDPDPALADLRVQVSRSLHDPTYAEPSWISREHFRGPINLLPWLLQKTRTRTALSISEYHYGGGADISGAVALVDALGAFAFYGVDTAAVWPQTNQTHAFTLAAFRVLRDGAPFGGQNLSARSTAIERVGVWAAIDQDLLHVVLVVRDNTPMGIQVNLPVPSELIESYQIDRTHPEPIATSVHLTAQSGTTSLLYRSSGRAVVRLVLRRRISNVLRESPR